MRRHGRPARSRRISPGWRTVRNAPLWGTYRGYRVSSNQPPGGGVMLLEMLNVLEHFPLGQLEHNSAEYVRIVAETMKRATIDKDRHVGDPRFVDVPVERLIGREYAAGLAEDIRARQEGAGAAVQRGGAPRAGHHPRLGGRRRRAAA